MVSTIFEKSRTPLQLWFYAIFLFTTSRHGVSAKELQRELGVTYKTAWRMAALMREHMAAADGDAPIGGEGEIVQIDETFLGGVRKGIRGRGAPGKTIVLGIMKPDGEVVAKVIPNLKRATIIPEIMAHFEPETQIHTDEMHSYKSLPHMGYEHREVHHVRDEYVGKDGTTVNAIENFWRHLKCSITGTHISVSGKHLERYVKKFEYRFNRRMRPETKLSELLSRFPELRS